MFCPLSLANKEKTNLINCISYFTTFFNEHTWYFAQRFWLFTAFVLSILVLAKQVHNSTDYRKKQDLLSCQFDKLDWKGVARKGMNLRLESNSAKTTNFRMYRNLRKSGITWLGWFKMSLSCIKVAQYGISFWQTNITRVIHIQQAINTTFKSIKRHIIRFCLFKSIFLW